MQEQGIDASAGPGDKSQFDIIRDGELVFSKHEEHRFPEPGEVLSLLQA